MKPELIRRLVAEFYGVVDAGVEDHDEEMNQLALLEIPDL